MNTELINTTLQYLHKTFTEKNNEERKKAEAELYELQEQIFDHICSILYILQSNDVDKKIKLSIVLYLKNLLKAKINEKKLSQNEIVSIFKVFIELYLSERLSDNLMQNLNLCLNDVLNSGELNEFIPEVIDYLKGFSTNIPKLKSIGYLIQLIISSSSTDSKNIIEILVKLIEIIDTIILTISQNMSDKNFLEIIDIARSVLDFLFLSLLKLKNLNKVSEVIDAYISKFIPFATNMILLTSQEWPNYIIFWTEHKEYDSTVNSMKSKALQLFSYIIQNENINLIKNTILTENIMKIMNIIIINLNFVIEEKSNYLNEMNKNNDNFKDNNYESLLFQILLFFSRILTRDPFMTEFKQHINEFVFDLIFPLLAFNKQDLIAIVSDDLISTHKNKSYRTAAGFLLTKIINRYDGLSKMIHTYCLKNIEACILNTHSNAKLTADKEIEVCLLVLSILQNEIKKIDNGELLLLVENYINKLLSIDLVVVKSRLCIFFETFLDYFNKKKENICINYETNVKIIHSLFNMLLMHKDAAGVSYQAANCLQSIIRYKSYGHLVGDICIEILPSLIQSISEIQVLLFFDVLNGILLYLDVEDKVMIICKEITLRILLETKSVNIDSHSYYNTYTNKCFNILITIVEKYKFSINEDTQNIPSLNEFEQTINPIMLYLKNPSKVSFDDDLIILLTKLIQNVEMISPYMTEVFAFLPKYIKKQGGINKLFYEFLISFIEYSGELLKNENALIILTQMICFSLTEYDELEESGPYAAILSRIVLERVSGVPDKYFTELITWNVEKAQIIYSTYGDDIGQLSETMDVNCFIANIVVIYTGFIRYPIITGNVISSMLEEFLEWSRLITNLPGFPPNLAKNIILGICNLLNSNSLSQNYLESFLRITFKLLSNIQITERDKLKRKLKDDLICNFIASDEEEDSDNEAANNIDIYSKKMSRHIKEDLDYSDTEDENDMTDVFKNIPDYFKSEDEYKIFSLTLRKLIETSPLLNEWVTNLPQDEKDIYVELLHTRRIKIKDLDMNVPRRIVKIKKI